MKQGSLVFLMILAMILATGCRKKEDHSKSLAVGNWYVPPKPNSRPAPPGQVPVRLVLKADGTSYITRKNSNEGFVHSTWSQVGSTITFKSDSGSDKGIPTSGAFILNKLADQSISRTAIISTNGKYLTVTSKINLNTANERMTKMQYERWNGAN